jgi:predicted metal-binding membrane protein
VQLGTRRDCGQQAVGGVMNVLWIALLALLVLLEKLTPYGRWVGRVVGTAGVVAGAQMLLTPSKSVG